MNDPKSRWALGWTLLIGLGGEGLLAGFLGILNALWVSTFAQFEGLPSVVPTLMLVVPTVIFLTVIIWGMLALLQSRSTQEWKGWKRAGVMAAGLVNVVGFGIIAVDLMFGAKFEQADYLQNLLGMVITAGVAIAAFVLNRRLARAVSDHQ